MSELIRADFELSIQSGMSTYRLRTNLPKRFKTGIQFFSLVERPYQVHIYGKFESHAALSKCSLTVTIDSVSIRTGQSWISQQVIDYVSQLDTKVVHVCNFATINDSTRVIELEIEIGLPPSSSPSFDAHSELSKLRTEIAQLQFTNSEMSNRLKNHKRSISQDPGLSENFENSKKEFKKQIDSLNQQLLEAHNKLEETLASNSDLQSKLETVNEQDLEFDAPDDNTVLALHLLIYHLIHVGSKLWYNGKAPEMFSLWKTKFKDIKPKEAEIDAIWAEISIGGKDSRFGLAKSIFLCHSTAKQEKILSGEQHGCSLFYECVLNHMSDETIFNGDIPQDMRGYFQYLIANEFQKSYFRNESSKFGLSILQHCWPLTLSKDFRKCFEAITSTNDDYADLSHLTKPDKPNSS